MTTKQSVSKTQAVRDYLNAHPGAGSREIIAALDKQGITIAFGHVATIKAVMYENAAPPASPAAEKPPATDMLTLDQLKKVAQAIKRIRSRLVV
jgi:hypothetical protein